jgi:hypothetical protein
VRRPSRCRPWATAALLAAAATAAGCGGGGGGEDHATAPVTTTPPAGVAAPAPAPSSAAPVGPPRVRSASGHWRLRRAPVVVDLGDGLLQIYVRLTHALDARPGRQALVLAVDGVPAGQTATGLGWTDHAEGNCYANTVHATGTRLEGLGTGTPVRVTLRVGTQRAPRQGTTVATTRARRALDGQETGGEPDARWYRALGCTPPSTAP